MEERRLEFVGRTGAGKSSILFILFHIVELDPQPLPKMIEMKTEFLIDNDPNEQSQKSRVFINEIDISKVEMSKVRRQIAIIPQDPQIFTDSLCYNLDIAGVLIDDLRSIYNLFGGK
ncbi:MAG: hypothetical protein EZS28_051216 [Streblomastix strix]|uniref:Uncharacterized protein n=1 Tax=Streblomastix strix TaxID=222440 RepID=A0A5J4T4V3_9EUKA|nr:MAG: hypothetical protein EZS28_051216 [Streblomastix strix]